MDFGKIGLDLEEARNVRLKIDFNKVTILSVRTREHCTLPICTESADGGIELEVRQYLIKDYIGMWDRY